MVEIKILSYNLWFEGYKFYERMESLIPLIEETNNDVLCFQEVTPEMFKILRAKLGKYKHCYPKDVSKNYEVVFFSKYIFDNESTYFLPTKMNRSLRVVKITIGNHQFTIGNCHFESEFKTEYKNETKLDQYRIVKSILDNIKDIYEKDVILCCDSNILESEEEYFFNENGWNDCWKLLGNDYNKFTYDYDTNEHLILLGRKYRSRLDRILCKGKLLVKDFNLVNNKDRVSPSDHHGISVIIEK